MTISHPTTLLSYSYQRSIFRLFGSEVQNFLEYRRLSFVGVVLNSYTHFKTRRRVINAEVFTTSFIRLRSTRTYLRVLSNRVNYAIDYSRKIFALRFRNTEQAFTVYNHSFASKF